MNHDFKIGDLALVINAKAVHENVGKVVEVVGLLPGIQEFKGLDGNKYIYRAANGPGCIVTGRGIKGRTIKGRTSDGWAVSPACWLMPLRGDFETSDRLSEVSVPS